MPVFSLSEVRSNQIKNYENTFEEQVVSNYGYLSGGYTPSAISDVERIDYSNDTISDSVKSLTVGYAGPTGSKNLGDGSDNYIYGGFPSPVNGSRISRFSYTNETFQNSPQNLPTDVGYMAQTSNSEYAFLGGGQSNAQSPTTINTVYRMSFSDETLSAPGTNLTSSKRGGVGFSNISFGYYANGFDPSNINTCNIDRLTFSDGTISTYSFLQKGSGYSSVCSTSQYAYIAGGYSPSDANNISSVQRYDFSSSTSSTTPFLLQTDKEGCTSLESPTTGYFGGGYQRPGGIISSGERIDFGTETVSNLQNLKSGRGYFQASLTGGSKITRGTPKYTNWKEYASYGYFGGGYGYTGGSYLTRTDFDRLDLSTETTAMLSVTATDGRRSTSAVTNGSKAYISGEDVGADILYSESDTISFNGVRGVVDNIERNANNFMNYDGTYGYINGGAPTTLRPTTKYDFGTDTAVSTTPYYRIIDDTSTAANLRSYGYAVGGYSSPPVALSKLDVIGRYEYDTETSSELTSRASFRSGASAQATNTSSELGYRFGGQGTSQNISSIERLDYSSGGTSNIIGNALNSCSRGMVAQDGSYGWIRGGSNPPAASTPGIMLCTIQRIDFSTETVSNPGQPSPVDRGSCQHGGISAGTALRQIGKNNRNDSRAGLDNQGRNVGASYGYFIGGENNAAYLTRNDRVDMLNETVSQSTNAPPGSKVACVTASAQRGYHILGENPGGANSNVTRIDLTNETFYDAGTNFPVSSASGKPHLRNTNYAYFNRGASAVETLDFETETFKPEQFHNVQSRSNSMNASTPQYGYVAGGTVSDIERLDFVSESRTTLNANLPAALNLGSGINQTRNGDVYFVGADNAAGSQVSRFSIATETISNPGNPLTKYHAIGGATQNENYGYLAAGYPFPGSPGGMSTMARIEFENDTTSNPGNLLTQSRYSVGSLSNGL